ncbi:unnamed protein product, partial [Sphagnum troendelagicum]
DDVKAVVLRVRMHCEGCGSTVKRIPGFSPSQPPCNSFKVTVTGNENLEDVVCRVAKTGKHTEFWPEEPKKGGKKEEKKEEKKEGVKDTKGEVLRKPITSAKEIP